VADSPEILDEAQGPHPERLDPSRRKRDLAKGKLEQRTRGNDMKFRHRFVEVAQSHDRSRASLDLIEEQQVVARLDAPTECDLELQQHAAGIEVTIKYAMQVATALEIEGHETTGKPAVAEVFDRPRLADLAGATHEERPTGG
jgi:hypothetical protein